MKSIFFLPINNPPKQTNKTNNTFLDHLFVIEAVIALGHHPTQRALPEI